MLEAEWDTGERSALLEQELEETPARAEESSGPVAAGSSDESQPTYIAVTEEVFGPQPAPTPAVPTAVAPSAAARPSAPPVAQPPTPEAKSIPALMPVPSAVAAPSAALTPKKQTVIKGPRVRTPTMPTPAQREAFQRALARRNAERAAGASTTAVPRARGRKKDNRPDSPRIDFSTVGKAAGTGSREIVGLSETRTQTTAPPPAIPSQSLSALARMATTKRPLPGGTRPQRTTQPRRRVVVFGSGIAEALIVGIVTFELLRSTPSVDHGQYAHATGPQLFSPNTLTPGNSSPPMQVFSPPPPRPVQAAAPSLPQPQTFDPDTAPPGPPPPPALERPGPMQPPSMAHNGPPLGMHAGWNTD